MQAQSIHPYSVHTNTVPSMVGQWGIYSGVKEFPGTQQPTISLKLYATKLNPHNLFKTMIQTFDKFTMAKSSC
jgi:hypothetical protein